jgi:hypothetical protein
MRKCRCNTVTNRRVQMPESRMVGWGRGGFQVVEHEMAQLCSRRYV